MRDELPAFAAGRGALTRRTLLGASAATLLGTLVRLPGARAMAAPAIQEVAVAPSRLALQTGDPPPSPASRR